MHNLAAHWVELGGVVWDYMAKFPHEGIGEIIDEGISFNFSFKGILTSTEVDSSLFKALSKAKIDWLSCESKKWIFFSEKFKSAFPEFQKELWLTGTAILAREFKYQSKIMFDKKRESTLVKLMVTPEIILSQANRIFLSHKNENKDLVRRYKLALESIGFSPWLDEDDMPAGTVLDRGLLNGFKSSCAVVFFITPEFVDESYLATEIEYAVHEKREKGDKFSIITLAMPNASGEIGKVPEMLTRYVYKTPNHDLMALGEIIRALPLKIPMPPS